MGLKKVWFNWHCYHCSHRNRISFPFQFEIPSNYTAIWECDRCGRESKIKLDLRVNDYIKPESFKIKKKKKDEGTKKDRGYRNDRARDIL